MPRTIVHLDLDAFFCAVEILRNPALDGIPFAVGGKPNERGVVASCSYPARQYGVRSAMPMSRAVQICPGLVIVPHHFDAYRAASGKVMAKLNNLSPMVEQISIDEAFLDVTGLPGSGEVIARRLQNEIRDELGLPSSLGVASNKLVAKIANNIGKAQARTTTGTPKAITIVPPGEEAAFLASLPIDELWGVGPKTAARLRQYGTATIGDLAQWRERDLKALFGKNGVDLARHARGLDERPVEADRETKSISQEITFTRDVRDEEVLRRTIRRLAEGVGRKLRSEGLVGTTVKIKLRWSDFTTLSRQITVNPPLDQDSDLTRHALAVFDQTWIMNKPVRLIGVGVTGLETAYHQPGLWDVQQSQQSQRWQATLDELRERFGDQAIQRGSDFSPEDDDM
ncbi:MAG TPA: DNA polymerase IV [Phototrophicaceae bacterium]|nr:DNA polymerase IV [Phototrophicaceae bacterium]